MLTWTDFSLRKNKVLRGRSPVHHEQLGVRSNMGRCHIRFNTAFFKAADLKDGAEREAIDHARGLLQRNSIFDPLKFPRGTEWKEPVDLRHGLEASRYAKLRDTETVKATCLAHRRALRSQPTELSATSGSNNQTLSQLDPSRVSKNYVSDRDPRLASGPSTATTKSTDDASTSSAIRIYSMFDQDIPGAEDVFRSIYNTSSGFPFAAVPPTVGPSNAYADANQNVLSTTTNSGQQVENCITEIPDVPEELFDTYSTFAENLPEQADEVSAIDTTSGAFDIAASYEFDWDLGAQMGGDFSDGTLDTSFFLPTLPSQSSFSGRSNEATPTPLRPPTAAMQDRFRDLSNQVVDSSFCSPAVTTQARFQDPSNEAVLISFRSPAVTTQDPFLRLSDQAAYASLRTTDRPAQQQTFNGHLVRDQSNRHGNTFIVPSMPASQSRMQSANWGGHRTLRPAPSMPQVPNSGPTTPLSGSYPHRRPTYTNPPYPFSSWVLFNLNQKPMLQDHYFPDIVDDQGPQVWFPNTPQYDAPKVVFQNQRANYYFNVGFKSCDELWWQAYLAAVKGIDTGHPAFSARTTSNTQANLTPLAMRPTSIKQQAANTGNLDVYNQHHEKGESGLPRSVVQTAPRPARLSAVISGRKGVGLPTKSYAEAVNAAQKLPSVNVVEKRPSVSAVKKRPSNATSHRPTEAPKVSGTAIQKAKTTARPRKPRPSGPGPVGEGQSIDELLLDAANAQEIELIEPLANSSLGKTAVAKRRARKREGSDTEFVMPRVVKRSRKSADSTAIVQAEELTRAESDVESLIDAEGDCVLLTAYNTLGTGGTLDGENDHDA